MPLTSKISPGSSSCAVEELVSPNQQQVMKRKIHLDFLELLNHVLERIKGPVPTVNLVEKHAGKRKIEIRFDSSLIPLPIKVGFNHGEITFKGSAFSNIKHAEQSVVLRVKRYLERKYGVYVRDISYEKKTKILNQCYDLDSMIVGLIDRINTFLDKLRSNLDILGKMAESLLVKDGPVWQKRYDDLVVLINETSTIHSDMMQKMVVTGLDHYNCYADIEALSAQEDVSVTVNLSEKYILDAFLLGACLPAAKYSHTVLPNNLYRGQCKLILGELGNTGKTKIHGEDKDNVIDAESSAAVFAIKYLEDKFGLEAVDFNHKDLVEKRQQFQSFHMVKTRFEAIAGTSDSAWQNLIDKLTVIIEQENEMCLTIGADEERYEEYKARMTLADELSQICNDISSAYAVAKLEFVSE